MPRHLTRKLTCYLKRPRLTLCNHHVPEYAIDTPANTSDNQAT